MMVYQTLNEPLFTIHSRIKKKEFSKGVFFNQTDDEQPRDCTDQLINGDIFSSYEAAAQHQASFTYFQGVIPSDAKFSSRMQMMKRNQSPKILK